MCLCGGSLSLSLLASAQSNISKLTVTEQLNLLDLGDNHDIFVLIIIAYYCYNWSQYTVVEKSFQAPVKFYTISNIMKFVEKSVSKGVAVSDKHKLF